MTASQPQYAPQGYPVRQPVLRAPDGTDPNTVWIWLLVALPALEILVSIPLLLSIGDVYRTMFGALNGASASSSSAVMQEILTSYIGILGPMIWVTIIGYLLSGIGILLGWLDWRALRLAGVPKPFHWAWGFFAFAGAGTLVYLIGRSVVARRRTDRGLAPLWAGIVVYVAIVIASIVWTFYLISTILSAAALR